MFFPNENVYIYELYICYSGRFPHLANRVNARVSFSILSKMPWTIRSAKTEERHMINISRIKVINIV